VRARMFDEANGWGGHEVGRGDAGAKVPLL
jgi:hypothetical protein